MVGRLAAELGDWQKVRHFLYFLPFISIANLNWWGHCLCLLYWVPYYPCHILLPTPNNNFLYPVIPHFVQSLLFLLFARQQHYRYEVRCWLQKIIIKSGACLYSSAKNIHLFQSTATNNTHRIESERYNWRGAKSSIWKITIFTVHIHWSIYSLQQPQAHCTRKWTLCKKMYDFTIFS